MKLTKNTWHYKFYVNMFGKNPNNNFCDYSWSQLLAVLTFPITFIPYFFRNVLGTNTYGLKMFIGILLEGLGLVITYILYTNALATIIAVGISLLIAGLVYLFLTNDWLDDRFDNLVTNISEIKDIVSEGYSSFKGRYCPKIDWE